MGVNGQNSLKNDQKHCGGAAREQRSGLGHFELILNSHHTRHRAGLGLD